MKPEYNYRITKVIRVHDGDTIYVQLDLGFNITMVDYIRFDGVDTPELNSADASERVRAQDARTFTNDWLYDRTDLVLHSTKYDDREKYGRILGFIYRGDDPVNLSEALVNAGLVKRKASANTATSDKGG